MRYSQFFAPAVLATSLLIAAAAQAAPILTPGSAPVTVPAPATPEPLLEKLSGTEFPPGLTMLADSASSPAAARPGKPRLQVPEPNGLILLSLGLFGMGVLRLRTKNQAL